MFLFMDSQRTKDRPISRQEFEKRFPDDAACARHLADMRWRDGFECPACGGSRGWELKDMRCSRECADCGRQTSVTAGTFMHRSHLPLKTWFLAAHLMATHSNGISALQAQGRLGTGSCNAAWLMLRKLRRATVNPDRTLLQGIAEVDEASVRCRSETAAKEAPETPEKKARGRSGEGKILLAGAVELSERGEPRRIRLERIDSYGGDGLRSFIAGTVEPGARVVTDGWSGQSGLPENPRDARVVGKRKAHEIPNGPTACSPTSSAGPWASCTASAGSISSGTWTSSSSGAAAAVAGGALSTRCSASACG